MSPFPDDAKKVAVAIDPALTSATPSGACPVCLKPIARKDFRIAKEFKCPNCQQVLRTSKSLRALMYAWCYGIPTILVYFWGVRVVWGVFLWIGLSFVCAMVFSALATAEHLPRLELFQKKEEFQSLNLSK
jgi:hypothetical protein